MISVPFGALVVDVLMREDWMMAKLPFRKDVPLSLTEIQDEINRMFDRFWHAGLATGPLDGQDWAPPLDVLEEPDRFVVTAEVPGLDTGDVEVAVSENVLTIRGHKSPERSEGEGLTYLRKERAGGSFSRSIQMPAEVTPDDVTASCKKGVLEIVLPKQQGARPKSVEIRVED
jgi:HSP20 family protein